MSPDPSRGYCRSCGAAVVWAWTVNDERMPVDPEPDPEGNVTLFREGDTETVRAYVNGPLELELLRETEEEVGAREELYTAHFVTCPDADYWRNP